MGIRQRSAVRRPQAAAVAAGIPAPGAAADRLEVVCYPQRVARAAPALALTPSQALRLLDDPRRAAVAARTAQPRRVLATALPPSPADPHPPAATAAPPSPTDPHPPAAPAAQARTRRRRWPPWRRQRNGF